MLTAVSRSSRTSVIAAICLTLVLTAYQLVRIITFINVYGGVEHDGGWMLGVSRSLAEHGTYSVMFNTIPDPYAAGMEDVHHHYNVQGPDGRMWFENSGVGPASIVPDAVVLKVFGYGFWALRTGPLLFYTLFLLLAAYLLFLMAGVWGIVLFHAFLYFYPHLSIFLSYEAMGEVPAMFYLLWAYLAFASSLDKERFRSLRFFGVGLLIGLAVNAKVLVLLPAGGILLWAAWLWLGFLRPSVAESSKQVQLRELLSLIGGVAAVQIVWQLVQMIVLTRLAGFQVYLRHMVSFFSIFRVTGSGFSAPTQPEPGFLWRKLLVMQTVSNPTAWVALLLIIFILLGGLLLLFFWRKRSWNRKQNLLAPLWLGWLVSLAWFVGASDTGWTRHLWFGLVLAVLLLSAIPASLVQEAIRFLSREPDEQAAESAHFRNGSTKKTHTRAAGYCLLGSSAVLLFLIGWGFACQHCVMGVLLPQEIVPYWLEKKSTYVENTGLPWIIIPRRDQQEVVEYIRKMPPEARVYYPSPHRAAEIPPQTGRIHYTLERRSYPGVKRHPADIVLVSPSIISEWRYDPVQRQTLRDAVERACPKPVLKNDNYVICLADEIRLP